MKKLFYSVVYAYITNKYSWFSRRISVLHCPFFDYWLPRCVVISQAHLYLIIFRGYFLIECFPGNTKKLIVHNASSGIDFYKYSYVRLFLNRRIRIGISRNINNLFILYLQAKISPIWIFICNMIMI